MAESSSVLNLLFLSALALLIVVSGGILYLTSIEWRDRRRQSEEKRK